MASRVKKAHAGREFTGQREGSQVTSSPEHRLLQMNLAVSCLCQAISKWRRPLVGAFLLSLMAGVFTNVYLGWNFVGKTTFGVYGFSGAADLHSILYSSQLVMDAAKRKKLPEHWSLIEGGVASKLGGMVEISVEKGSDVISVEVYGDDPVESADLANAVRDSFEDRLRSAERERFANRLMALDNKVEVLEKEVEISGKELGMAEAGIMLNASFDQVPSEASTANLNRLKTEHPSKLQLLEELKNLVIRAPGNEYLPRYPMEILEIAKPGTVRVWRFSPVSHLVGICVAAVAAAGLIFWKTVSPARAHG